MRYAVCVIGMHRLKSVLRPAKELVKKNTALAVLEFKAPKEIIRLSLYLTGLWTSSSASERGYSFGVLVEVQAARKLVVMHTFIVAA